MKSFVFIVLVHAFFVLTCIGKGDQRLINSTKIVNRTSKNQRPSALINKVRFIGIWTADYKQFGVASGAIVINIARESPAAQLLRLNDVIFAICGNNVGSSQDLIDAIPLIPPSQDDIVFDILRDGKALSVSCKCLYLPPINLTQIYDEIVPSSLGLALDPLGNKIFVAPMAYIARLHSQGGMEAIEQDMRKVIDQEQIGVYHTFSQKTCYIKGRHDLAIPATLLKAGLGNQFESILSEVLVHYEQTKEKLSCYVIHLKNKTSRQDLSWSVTNNTIITDYYIDTNDFRLD